MQENILKKLYQQLIQEEWTSSNLCTCANLPHVLGRLAQSRAWFIIIIIIIIIIKNIPG
jgi:hypothetical protein